MQDQHKHLRAEAAHTYVNPLPLPAIPRGKDDWYRFEPDLFSHENKPAGVVGPDYRSISDPTVFYHEGKWYLYPSYGMAWVTEDFEHWEHVRTEPYCPKYSPAITPWRDKFLLVSWNSPLYVGKTPLGPFEKLGEFILPDGSEYRPCDPCIFTDDDGRIYMYAFLPEQNGSPEGFASVTMGFELDREEPWRIIRGPVEVLRMHPGRYPWERYGRHKQNKRFGWVEGPHLLKYGGRYYLIYAAPDTRTSDYCMAVYYSDESPLDGFVCQERNPLTFHTEGIVAGAGHGCVERGPNGTLWAFYTIAVAYAHQYERRIGMDLVAVDERGELYCPHGVTDVPQYVPGYASDPVADNAPELCNLTGEVRGVASSCAPGRDALYATDENNRSFWQPAEGDEAPWLFCDLEYPYLVSAARIFWRDVGLDYAAGAIPVPYQYMLEGRTPCGEWVTLCDRRDSDEELNIDYRTFDTTLVTAVRLTVTGWGQGLTPGVIDFAVFGRYPDFE